MRLDWVKERLQKWAAWKEKRKYGRVASPKIDGMPHAAAAGATVPEKRTKEEETQKALNAMNALYPDYGETIALVYWAGPAAHKVGLAAQAEWIGVTKDVLFHRIEAAESKFSEMLDKRRDAQDLVL